MDDFALEQEAPEPEELEKEWDEWDEDNEEEENENCGLLLDEAFSSWEDFNTYKYR